MQPRLLEWPDRKVSPDGKLHLRALDEYVTLLEFVRDAIERQGASRTKGWQIKAFVIDDSIRPVARLDPADVDVTCARSAAHGLIKWGVQRKRRDGAVFDVLDDLEEETSGEATDSESSSNTSDSAEGEGAASGSNSSSSFSLHDAVSSDSDEGRPPPPPPAPAVAGADLVHVAPDHIDAAEDGADEPSGEEVAAVPKAAPRRRPGLRGKADMEIEVEGGVLRYYGNKNAVIAHCERHGHHLCRLTRTLSASMARGRAGQGRPVGMLCAWLASADHEDWDAAGLHSRMSPLPDLEARILARSEFNLLPDADAWLALERPVGPEEDEEPEKIP